MDGLIKRGEAQITASGALYLEQLSDTLHRVRRYKVVFLDRSERVLKHEQYERLERLMTSSDAKFVKFDDGTLVAVSQIAYVKPFEAIIDTRKEDL